MIASGSSSGSMPAYSGYLELCLQPGEQESLIPRFVQREDLASENQILRPKWLE